MDTEPGNANPQPKDVDNATTSEGLPPKLADSRPPAKKAKLLQPKDVEDIRRELNDNNKQITQYKDDNNKLLGNLYYKSLIEYYLNTIVIPRSEEAVRKAVLAIKESGKAQLLGNIQPAESQLHDQLLYLQQNIVSKYKSFKDGDEDIIVDLLSDFQTLQKILEQEFLFQKERNVIKTQQTNLIPYLKEIFDSDTQRFEEINTLIKQKQERDTKIQELCDKNGHLEKILILSANPDQLTQEEMQIKMQTQETTPSNPRPHNIFLLVCHGSSVSQFKNYFRTRIYCKNIEYLVDHEHTLYLRDAPDKPGTVTPEDLDAFQKFHTKLNKYPDDGGDIDKYLDDYRGSYKDDHDNKYKKNEVLESDKEYAYLPPMVFSPITTDEIEEKNQLYNSIMGLYHYILNSDDNQYYIAHVIANYDKLVEEVQKYGGYLTYSSITSLIRNYLRSVVNGEIELERKEHTDYIKESDKVSTGGKDLFDNSSMKFFSCRSYYKKQLIDENLLAFFNSQVVVNYEPKPVTFFDSFDKDDDDKDINNISLFTINLEHFHLQQAKENWQGPLADLYHQGCGLNVLNFYDLTNTVEARSAAACLNMGTSIFKIADYIVKNNSQYLPIDGFGVCRIETVKYFKLINRLINDLVKNRSITNTFTGSNFFGDLLFMFRVYEKNFKGQTNDEYNDIGHVVSIALKDNSIHFIDPQTKRFFSKEYTFSFVDTETISQFLNSIFETHYRTFEFCDFFIYKRSFSNLTFTQLQQDYGCVLRPRPPKLSFGGKNTIKKRQRVLKTHKKPRNYTVKMIKNKKTYKNTQKK